MLRQDINLYNFFSEPESTRSILTWRRFCMLIGLGIVILIINSLYSLWYTSYLETKKSQIITHVQDLQKNYLIIKNSLPPLFFTQGMNLSVKQLNEEVAAQNKVLQTILNQLRFSQSLLSFSKNITSNVWLTEIIISSGGKAINIKGQSIDMNSLQQFIQNLMRDKIFNDYRMTLDNVINSTKENKLSFSLTLAKNL